MQSKVDGKKEVIEWINNNFDKSCSILDVGAGYEGTYRKLLPEYNNISAVEIYKPSAEKIKNLYETVYNIDIKDFDWTDKFYDLIIFGDIIEHLSVDDAKEVLEEAAKHCKDMIVAVPFEYRQGPIDGNEAERHIQDDLTHELMIERYGNILKVLVDPGNKYCYYHKK